MAFVVTSTPKASIDVDRARHGFSFGYYDKSCTGKILYSKRKLDDDTDHSSGGIFDTFQKSPGTLLLAPFLFLFGLDIIANIAVITKRSLEVLFTGEYTVWNPFS